MRGQQVLQFDATNRLASALSHRAPTRSRGLQISRSFCASAFRAADVRRDASSADRNGFIRAWLEMPVCRLFPESFDWLNYGLLAQRNGIAACAHLSGAMASRVARGSRRHERGRGCGRSHPLPNRRKRRGGSLPARCSTRRFPVIKHRDNALPCAVPWCYRPGQR